MCLQEFLELAAGNKTPQRFDGGEKALWKRVRLARPRLGIAVVVMRGDQAVVEGKRRGGVVDDAASRIGVGLSKHVVGRPVAIAPLVVGNRRPESHHRLGMTD